MANSCVQPSVQLRSVGSFPEQRLVIEPMPRLILKNDNSPLCVHLP